MVMLHVKAVIVVGVRMEMNGKICNIPHTKALADLFRLKSALSFFLFSFDMLKWMLTKFAFAITFGEAAVAFMSLVSEIGNDPMVK